MSFSTSAGIFSQNAFLNPGPAPTPPDHSGNKLSNIDNLNQYPKRLNSHSPTSSDIYDVSSTNDALNTLASTTSSISNNTTTPGQRDDPKGRFVKHGWAIIKEDGSFKMWNKKYLVLRESCLEFYKNEVRIVAYHKSKPFSWHHQDNKLLFFFFFLLSCCC